MVQKLKEITCPDCDGAGEYFVIDYLYWNGDQDSHDEICSRCFGEGTILVDDEDYDEEEDDE